MLHRLRVSLPDRPGALGGVTKALGAAGADILQVTVLESVAGRALDELTVDLPTAPVAERVAAGLAAVPGLRIEGLWRTAEQPAAFGDLGVLAQVAGNPARGVATLTDALPRLFSADWAAVVRTEGEPDRLAASWRAPDQLPPIRTVPLRSKAYTEEDGTQFALAPLDGMPAAVVVSRHEAPPFHELEVVRLSLLVEVVSAVVGKHAL